MSDGDHTHTHITHTDGHTWTNTVQQQLHRAHSKCHNDWSHTPVRLDRYSLFCARRPSEAAFRGLVSGRADVMETPPSLIIPLTSFFFFLYSAEKHSVTQSSQKWQERRHIFFFSAAAEARSVRLISGGEVEALPPSINRKVFTSSLSVRVAQKWTWSNWTAAEIFGNRSSGFSSKLLTEFGRKYAKENTNMWICGAQHVPGSSYKRNRPHETQQSAVFLQEVTLCSFKIKADVDFWFH